MKSSFLMIIISIIGIIISTICITCAFLLINNTLANLSSLLLSIGTGLITSSLVTLFFELKNYIKQRQLFFSEKRSLYYDILDFKEKQLFCIFANRLNDRIKIIKSSVTEEKLKTFIEALKKFNFDANNDEQLNAFYDFFDFHSYRMHSTIKKIYEFKKSYNGEISPGLKSRIFDIDLDTFFEQYHGINSFYVKYIFISYPECCQFLGFLIELKFKIDTLFNFLEKEAAL